MKKITRILIVVVAFISQNTYAQTLLWSEDFGLDAGCTNQNQQAIAATSPNGNWTQTSTAAEGADANQWFVSSTEAFTGTGTCGDGCPSNPTLDNQTLHLGSIALGVCPTGDCGATYNVGATGETHKRIESPVINATGVYGLSISFDYMHFGEGTSDKAGLVYFDGTTWSTLIATLPKTACCGGGCGTPLAQGQWAATKYTLDLPISANNNPNIKIGILWDNDANGVGADPSFAIDTIEVTYAVSCASFTTNIVYVDENGAGGNNGTSWVDAFTDLQDAITAAEVCASVNTIYIAEGTYYPTTTTNRTISFEIPGNTNVYGGFSPNNGVINLVTRDFNTYPTILDGDIGVLATTTDNSYHVISLLDTGTTNILDGLIIRNGYANGGGTNNLGGGIYAPNAQQEITVINSTISNNFATESGGGFYVKDAGNVYVFTTKINFNTSANLGGGFSNVNSELRTENVLFHDNSATLGGGLNYETSSLLFDVEIIGNTFTQNTASTTGSAIYLNNTGEVIFYFINNIFWNNGPGSIDMLNFPNLTQAGSNSLYESGPLTGDCCLFDVDPLFTNPATYDFTLQPTSPVIDFGVNGDITQATDLNGNTRITDGNSDGTATVDYGAYEAAEVPDTTPPIITCPADIMGDCGTNPITYTVTVTDNITNPFPPLEPIAGFTFLGTNQNKTYYLSDAPATADVAFANAAGLGVTVATVEDGATNTYLRNAITAQAGGIQVYIGYNDATTEGAFEWQSGSTATYTNWNPGEPNDLGGEDYTLMTGAGSWNDVSVAAAARYVIEYFGTLEQTAGFPPNSDFPLGTTTNTFVATDFSGNTDTCSFDVTLTDTTDPVIVCPGNITQDNDPGICGAFVNYNIPVPTDDCDPVQPATAQQIDHLYNSSIFCNTGSSHLRIFNLPTEGINTDYLLENINLGIASTNTTESYDVNIYLGDQLENAVQNYVAPLSSQIPPLFSVTMSSPGFNTFVDIPVNIFIPTNETVIVEIYFPVDANTRAIYNNDTTSETAEGYLNCTGGNFATPASLGINYGLLIRLEGQEYLQQTTIQTSGLSPNSLFPVGTTTNTFVVTDGGGNTDTCSFDITINDTELPVLTCPTDIIIDNDLGICGAVVEYEVTGFENCDVAPIPGFELIGFTNEKAYYISDGIFTGPDAFADALLQGGVVATIPSAETQVFLFDRLLAKNKTYVHIGLSDATVEGTFEWQDGSPVTYTNWAPGQPGAGSVNRNYVQLYSNTFWYNDVDDSAAFPYILELANTTILTQTSGFPSGSEFPIGTTTNTFEVTDPSGNTGTCSFDITVNDTEAPVAVCMDITIQLDATGNATIIATDVDGGSTDNCAVTDYQIDIDTFTCADVGNPVTVTLTVFDDAFNSDTCTAVVTVEDVTAPSITCPGDQTENFDANCEFVLPDYTGLATVSDTCDPAPSLTQTPAPGTTVTGNTVVTLTATDADGNSDFCTFSIIPIDVTPPTISCPGDQTEDFDANCEFTLPDYTGLAIVSDSCDPNPLVIQSPVAGTVITSTTQITLFAEDASGNINSCVFDVLLVDVTAPAITCPADQTEDFDANCEFTLPDYTGLATATDSCDPNPSVTQSPVPGTIVSTNTVITLTATDASGNSDSCTFTVLLVDVTPPTITCPADQTEDLDANCEFTLPDYTGLATVSDSCDPNPLVTQSPVSGTVITSTTQITLFAEDASGNINSCVFDVIPVDTTPPTITCPEDQTEVADAACMLVLPDYTGLAIATDNCGSVSIIQIPAPGTLVGQGITLITLETSDGSNLSNCTFNVTVEDTTPPTAVCQAFTAQLDAAGIAVITPADVDGGSSDNCSIASMSVSPNTFSCADVGNQTVTLTVTDTSGNISTCDAIVTVEDTIPPTAVCQDITVSLGTENSITILPGELDGGSSDNCSVASVTASQTTFTCDDIGMSTVTVTVTDVNGNTNTCTSIVTIIEDTPPIAVCQNFTAQLDATGTVIILPSDVNGGSTDNCAIDTITLSQDTFDCDDVGENIVTMTVTDISGNSASCTAIVTVEDTIAPDAVCQNITVQLDATGMATIEPQDLEGGSFDACGVATIAIDIDSFDCSNVGLNNVTLTVTDVNGNVSTCIAIVTVEEENANPVAICQNITVPLQLDGTAVIEASDIDAGSTGGGCVNGVTIDIDTFDCGDIGTPIQVTLSVMNGNGTIDTCTAFVNVVDTLDPLITCPADQVIPAEQAPYTLPDYVALGEVFAEDNCLDITSIVQTPPAGTILEAGEYNINFEATDPSGNEATCFFRLTIEEEIVLGVPISTSLASISVFPNPANNFINIANPNHIELRMVQLYDITGRLIKTFQVDNTTDQRMDISEIASATYLLLITAENGQITKQIVKE